LTLIGAYERSFGEESTGFAVLQQRLPLGELSIAFESASIRLISGSRSLRMTLPTAD
jgi:hypothetical protein